MKIERRLLGQETVDWPLFLVASALAVIGIVNLYSATSATRVALSGLYIQQIYWLVLGGVLALGAALIDYRHFERLAYWFYAGGIVLVLLVFVVGKDVRGSSRWIYIGSFSLQPSEFMKIFMVVALARYFHGDPRTEGRSLGDLAIPAVLAGIPTFLVLRQPDLGTALILILVFGSMCALTKIRWKSIAWLFGTLAVLIPVAWTYVMKDYQKRRITDFLNPDSNLRGTGWHAHHARVAVGNGGWVGQGFLQGSQNQFHFIPDQYSDFPFAVFAEEWGFLGTTTLILLYATLILWAIRVASSARDRFGSMIAIGVGAIIFWHAVFNLGMVVGLLPVVGVTLPLFSSGGSSVLTVLLGLGLLTNVSIHRRAA